MTINDPLTGDQIKEAMIQNDLNIIERENGGFYSREGEGLFWNPGDGSESQARPWDNLARWINMIPDKKSKREILMQCGFTFIKMGEVEEIYSENPFKVVNPDTLLHIGPALNEEIARTSPQPKEPAPAKPLTEQDLYIN